MNWFWQMVLFQCSGLAGFLFLFWVGLKVHFYFWKRRLWRNARKEVEAYSRMLDIQREKHLRDYERKLGL